ncbi:2,3,4,5-tetrahydropyridine-2,6-dicarboxylate N-acetyltransferase [Sedimentibacter sp. zth1]|uniref:2,3,4,5-tetrahydropyridine-2,6-dicarboxylate N-acetyltransferase n=1 Tax=Sedimentibacter sp. zth1 TaxID=2816908 RepID=UPI001A91F025|nr:2,3,4,5-tetrahydropyridine-2,6-dicarboxylate N-acetyltransferase [Sedimentibacter sp. zth1]QSX05127.1 2,3,4,5-tetrahydropyridine-2,6-dicarboxylate N-acetyltransferase [Sedimentibacter sp. zth1]
MDNLNFENSNEIINYIRNSKKSTVVKMYVEGKIRKIDFLGMESFKSKHIAIAFGQNSDAHQILKKNKNYINNYYIENSSRNSAIPMLDIKNLNARIEPGAIIRQGVTINDDVIVMMGAVVNIGAIIGKGTMLDMNCVIGARAIIGEYVHVGAGAVVAGVLEPPSKTPVIIEDNVLIGANAVILEGIKVCKGAVVGAGAVVTKDVAENSVVTGIPAKKIKERDRIEKGKTTIVDDLRRI